MLSELFQSLLIFIYTFIVNVLEVYSQISCFCLAAARVNFSLTDVHAYEKLDTVKCELHAVFNFYKCIFNHVVDYCFG